MPVGPEQYARAADRLAAEAHRKLLHQLGRQPAAAEVWWLVRTALQALGAEPQLARTYAERAAEQLLGPIALSHLRRAERLGYEFLECPYIPGAYGWVRDGQESNDWFPSLRAAVRDANDRLGLPA